MCVGNQSDKRCKIATDFKQLLYALVQQGLEILFQNILFYGEDGLVALEVGRYFSQQKSIVRTQHIQIVEYECIV
jgi:hypothetical protein